MNASELSSATYHAYKPHHSYDHAVALLIYTKAVGKMACYQEMVRLGVEKFRQAIRTYYREVILMCETLRVLYLNQMMLNLANYGGSLLN